jgi:hypothetical protein
VSALRELTWVELKLFLREPLTVVFVLVLPLVVLYVLNGVFGSQPDPSVWEGHSPIDFYTSAYVGLVVATDRCAVPAGPPGRLPRARGPAPVPRVVAAALGPGGRAPGGRALMGPSGRCC